MAQLIKLKRGTRSQIVAGLASNVGEPVFATDSKELYIYDGVSANLIGKPLAGTLVNRPSPGVLGRMYYATDEQYLYIDEVTGWRLFDPVGVQPYDKVENTDFTTGNKRLILVDASTADVTITLNTDYEVDGRTYFIARIDNASFDQVVFVEGTGISFLIGQPDVAVGNGHSIGGVDLNNQRYLEVVWDGSQWQKLTEIKVIDGGTF